MSKTYSAGFAYRIFHILIIGLLLFSSLGTAVESVAAGPSNIPQLDPYTCTDPLGCVDIAPTEPIHIAYALLLSGDYSFLGIDSRNAVEIAIDDLAARSWDMTSCSTAWTASAPTLEELQPEQL